MSSGVVPPPRNGVTREELLFSLSHRNLKPSPSWGLPPPLCLPARFGPSAPPNSRQGGLCALSQQLQDATARVQQLEEAHAPRSATGASPEEMVFVYRWGSDKMRWTTSPKKSEPGRLAKPLFDLQSPGFSYLAREGCAEIVPMESVSFPLVSILSRLMWWLIISVAS